MLTPCSVPGVKFRRQHWLFLLICLLVFVIILSIYLPIASRVDNIEVESDEKHLKEAAATLNSKPKPSTGVTSCSFKLGHLLSNDC